MEIDWGLLGGPPDIGAHFQAGFKLGQGLRQQHEMKSALAGYIANPSDTGAQNALAAVSPEFGLNLAERRSRVADQQAERERIGSFVSGANGDYGGAATAAMSAGYTDVAKQFLDLQGEQQKQVVSMYKGAAPIAQTLLQTRDPAQRAELFAKARPLLEADGWQPAMLDKFDVNDDATLTAVVNHARTADQLIADGAVKWVPIGEQGLAAFDSQGRPVGARNPYSTSVGGAGVAPAPASSASGPRGVRNNNPLNLTQSSFTASQTGYAGTDEGGRYARFASPDDGLRAAHTLLGSYIKRGFDTPAEIIGRWAPAKENGASTANYVDYVSRTLGISPNDTVAPNQIPQLASAMSNFENGKRSSHARAAVAPSTGAANPVPVHNKTEFAQLASGTKFIAPDGSIRVKP